MLLRSDTDTILTAKRLNSLNFNKEIIKRHLIKGSNRLTETETQDNANAKRPKDKESGLKKLDGIEKSHLE